MKITAPDTTDMTIALKRAYDETEPEDGYRVLVDRLWPHGISKSENKYLWPKARKALSADEEADLSESFHRIETVKLGKGFHEKYHGMAMEILGKEKQ